MKKALLLIITLLLTLALCACGNTHSGGNGGNDGEGGTNDGGNSGEGFDPNRVSFTSAYNRAKDLGFEGTLDEFIKLISGKDGADGKDGISVVSVQVNEDGKLIVQLSDNTTVDCGKVVGKDGADGKDGVTPTIEISEDGYWVINGEKTEYKAVGSDNKYVATIAKVEFDELGRLVITLTDGTVLDPVEIPEASGHKHAFGEWISYGNSTEFYCESRLFYRICSDCAVLEWKSGTYENHDFEVITTPSTCTEKGYDTKTCRICGMVEVVNETETVDHVWESSYTVDNSSHWKKCKNCKNVTEYAEHTPGDDGICTVCDTVIGATEGLEYDISADGTYAMVAAYGGSATRIKIAEEYEGLPVKIILDEAFYNNNNITSIIIPDSVTSIGDEAFYECYSLTSVTIPDSVTSIGSYAFYNCASLTSVTIPDSVTSIGEEAFFSCDNLTSVMIGDSVTSIGDYAFSYCYSLTSVTLGNSLTSIGGRAFSWCRNLTNITIPDSVTSIGGYAFENCSRLTSVTIGDGVNFISASAFEGCPSSLFIENRGVKYLKSGDNPYAVLLEITNKNLSSYEINPDTKIISYGAFSDCGRLKSITIPDSVTSICNNAFSYCYSLTSVTIGSSLTSIGYYAFTGCSSLTSVYITDLSNWCAILFGNDYANPLYYANNLYLNGELVTDLVIPDSVTSIGDYAFKGCDNLTSVTIPDRVTYIGEDAFLGCYKMVEVINKSSLNITCGSAEHGYVAYYAIEVHKGESKIVNLDDYLFYTYEGENYLFGYAGNETELTLPGSYKDEVYEIYNYAFRGCSSLTSVTIPDSVISIGNYAFNNCSSLTSATIGDGVTSIGEYAFSGCYKLVEVINKSSLNITCGSKDYGHVAYYAIEVHNGESKIVTLDDYLFYTSKGVNYLFGYVGNETEVSLPESYNGEDYEIYDYTFYNCDSLTSVTIGDSVTSIGEDAFWDCDSLTSVMIPDSVTFIGEDAFAWCHSPLRLYYKGTKENSKSINNEGYSGDTTYPIWYYYSETKPMESGNYWHYDENGEIAVW